MSKGQCERGIGTLDPPAEAPDLESTSTLLERLRHGDREALERLYRRYLGRFRVWARSQLPDPARDAMDTDDLVQETLLRTLNGIQDFEPEHSGAFQAYVRRAIRNRICDEIRRIGRRPQRDGTVGRAMDLGPSPIERAIGREQLRHYEAALMRLTPVEREAIVARCELCLPYREVALAIGKSSPDAARMTVKRALVRLAREMADAP